MSTVINMPQDVRAMTIEINGETKIVFTNEYNSIAIRCENDVGICEFPNKEIGDDGVLKCNAGESIIYPNLISKRYIYLIGTGKVEFLIGNNLSVNPFKNGGKGGGSGGGGGGSLNFLGTTTTEITDGSTVNPIIIDGQEVTAKKADWVIYNNKDFVFNGTIWQKSADMSNYYTKSEVDELLGTKADIANVYTKEQLDTMFVNEDDTVNHCSSSEIVDSIDRIWG